MENVPVLITLPKKWEAIWKPEVEMLVGRFLNKSCEFFTLFTFKDADRTSVMVGSNAAKTNENRPADKKSSKLGNWSSKRNATTTRMIIMVMLSFLRCLSVRTKKKDRLNTPAFARTNADWPEITLIIDVNHATQSRNNRSLSMFIWNEEGMAEAVYGFQNRI